ncbi:MAG: hypothetical protein GY795_31915 [Desulfobacterales bacterium]|nr:hypothetical protein [Desulfobacterales bacterium]
MKKVVIAITCIFSVSLSYAGILGDINNDSKIDLSETIYALQVTAGIRIQLGEQYFNNIKAFSLDAANTDIKTDSLTLSNVRIESDEISLDDVVNITLKFNETNKSFLIESVDILKNIGVYNDWHFAKDVTSEIVMYKDSQQFNMDQTYYNIISEGEEYYMDLEIGQVISFLNDNPDNDFIFKIKDPDNQEIYNYIGTSNQGVISSPISIMKAGRYTIQYIPFLSQNVTLDIRFLNANRENITEINNNDYVSASFKNSIRDYVKYKVYLNENDLLSLQKPSDSNIAIKIVNSNSKKVASGNGLPVKYIAESAGYYYIFINNNKGWGGSYGSTATITPIDIGNNLKSIKKIYYKTLDFNATPSKP